VFEYCEINKDKYEILEDNSYITVTNSYDGDLTICSNSLSEFSLKVFEDYVSNILIKSRYVFYAFHKLIPSIELITTKRNILSQYFDIVIRYNV
jgi:hypothetical protein